MAITRLTAPSITGLTIPNTSINNASLNSVTALPSGIDTGKVGQVVSTHTNATGFSTSSSTLVDVTGTSVSITPSATDSKILIQASVTCSGTETRRFFVGLKRDSTVIASGDASGSRLSGAFTGAEQEGNNALSNFSVSFLDTPNKNTSTTYQITGCAEGGDIFKLNVSAGDGDSSSVARGASTITLTEILA